jgi:glycosyltransferase involved in cell wall biosynthesis
MPDVWIACHGPLACNSGNHVRALAVELARKGFAVRVCVPERSAADDEVPAEVAVATFAEALRAPVAPALVHLWTTRERMRHFHAAICRRFGGDVPHVVHLEDDEALLLAEQMRLTPTEIDDVRDGLRPLDVPDHLTHPLLGGRLLATAAGVTALAEPLVEGLAPGLPVAVFRPGYDPIFAAARPAAPRAVRARLGLSADRHLVTYTGNVHTSNVDEVRSLAIAVALVNRMGLPVTLVRTGQDHVPLADHGADVLAANTVALGVVPRDDLPDLVHAADILVQPGRVDRWNAHRFPSKLPDFLVSGRPVILPRVNVGTLLDPGREAIVLAEATAEPIARALLEWLPRRHALDTIGRAGAAFARRELTWSRAADLVAGVYDRILATAPAAAEAPLGGPV